MINAKRKVYKDKFDELLQDITSVSKGQVEKKPDASVFVSYSWKNSHQAVKLGTK